jgi:serine/threonine-protein kinase HipA
MSETRLFPSKTCDGYFGTKRFDRRGIERIHMMSASALLEHSHRLPTLDYHTLMKLTLALTQSYKEVEKLYRLMCFNVFAHNRDDHAKNFAFLYEPEIGWRLAPAYDLTYSNSTGGEHATTVNGNGSNPSLMDLYAVAEAIGLSKETYKHIAEQVRSAVMDALRNIRDCFYGV